MWNLSKFLLVAFFPLILGGCKIEMGSTSDATTAAAASITDGLSLSNGSFTVDNSTTGTSSMADAAGSAAEAAFAADAASGTSTSTF